MPVLAALASWALGDKVTVSAGLELSGSEEAEGRRETSLLESQAASPLARASSKGPMGPTDHPGRRLWKWPRTAQGKGKAARAHRVLPLGNQSIKEKSLSKVDMAVGTQPLEALGAGPGLPACSHNALHPLPQLQP